MGSAATTAEEADAFFRASNWKGAAAAYREITASAPQQERAWYRLGHSLLAMGNAAEAIAPLRKAVELRPAPSSMYELGAAYAASKQSDEAFVWLAKAFAGGYSLAAGASLFDDPNLDGLRGDPRVAGLRDTIERTAHPCRFAPEFRQFDFWLGEWDVHDPEGKRLARSSVQLILDDCVLFENYDADGYEGKSFSTWDRDSKSWQQRWIDNGGAMRDLRGALVDGAMVLERDSTLPDGRPARTRMSYSKIDGDRVRQRIEVSTDGSKSWSTAWEGIYVRRR
jgi:tetratricopeptide (TPR) repeat protein